MSRRVFLVGGHITPFVGKGSPHFKKDAKNLKDYFAESIQGALHETGVKAEWIDRSYVGNFAGELFNSQGHLGAAIAGADSKLMNKPSMRLEAACASGGIACSEAVRAIQAGDDCVLAVGVELQTTTDARTGGTYLARASDFERQSKIDDFTFPALFARRVKAYLEKYPHVSLQDVASVAAKSYDNGNKNPLAHMQATKMSLEKAAKGAEFLSNKEFRPFLRVTDCSQVSDGGAAAIFMSEEALTRHGISLSDTVEVLGTDQAAGDLWSDPKDLTELTTAKTVVARVMSKVGVKPADIQVVELHDCFAIAEVLMYEAIGLAEPGKGIDFFKTGAPLITGKVPVNTGGGLLAFGHPVGATGVKQVLEVYRQMKGKCGNYQMAQRPQLGLTVNMGGDDKTVAAMILRNNAASKL